MSRKIRSELIAWVLEWKWFLGGAGGFILPVVFFLTVDSSDFTVRFVGMLLQLFGIITVIEDIRETYQAFDYPCPLTVWKDRLKRCPLIKQPDNVGSINATLPAMTGSGKIDVSYEYDIESENLDERFNAVKERFERFSGQIQSLQDGYENRFKEVDKKLLDEKNNREQDVESVREKVREISTESLHMAGTGIVWLIIGMIFTSIPDVIVSWFQ